MSSLLRVLVLQRLQQLGLQDIHPAELRFPFVDTGVADAMLAAQIGDRNADLMLLQNPDDLLFRKATALHALVLVMGQSERQTGLSPRGNITREACTAAGPRRALGGHLMLFRLQKSPSGVLDPANALSLA